MLIGYVKHYLNSEGKNYFESSWFPEVEKIISQQPGFVSIEYTIDEKTDCVDLTVKFQNMETANAWNNRDEHNIVDLLDPFRTSTIWRVALTTDPAINPDLLEWGDIEATNKGE